MYRENVHVHSAKICNEAPIQDLISLYVFKRSTEVF